MVWPGGVARAMLALGLVGIITNGRKVGLVRFQNGDVATTESLLDTGLGGLPSLQQVTLVLHLRLRQFTAHMPLLNYAVDGCNEELFVELVPRKGDLHVQCCAGQLSRAIPFTLKMFVWQHIAVSLNLETGILHVIYDNMVYHEKVKLSPEKRVEVRAGGRLVVGQRLYSMDGGFLVREIVDGEIADYRIYDVALEPTQMDKLINCTDVPDLTKPLIDLETNNFTVKGPTLTRTIEMNELCSNNITGFYLFFSQKMNFKNAQAWCRKLKGSIILPEDAETNAFFFDKFVSYKDDCAYSWTHLYWIGAGGNLTTQHWLKLTDGTPITWYQFIREYKTVTTLFKCIAAITHEKYKWAACPCNIETCILCNFTAIPQMRLRGLCKDSALDRLFSFRDNEHFEWLLDGFNHMVMQKMNDSWIMRSRLWPGIKATMVARWKEETPVGVHIWFIEGDRCLQKQQELLLTSCRSNEYTCDDGLCISKNRRCDMTVDCEDQSDEMNCKTAIVPPGYSSGLLPPTILAQPLPILFSLNITSVREFNLVSFTISIDVFLELKWRDMRLKFNNLNKDFRANKIKDLKEVWTPEVKIEDGTKSKVESQERSQVVYVVKMSEPLPDDDSSIREDIVYSGSENMMDLQSETTLTFRCHFKLQMYPFDQQLCYIVFRVQDVPVEQGILVQEGAGVVFLGVRQLLEYTLISETYTNYTFDAVSLVMVEFVFRNQYGYYVSNTFLPSIMLVVICCACFSFDIADFEDRVMVSLTALLVLATFFTQTSGSIPKTAYLKLIDVWFVALISEVFIIIMALVYIEVLRLTWPATYVKVSPAEATKDPYSNSLQLSTNTRAVRVNSFLLKFFFVTTNIMLLSFASVFTFNIFSR